MRFNPTLKLMWHGSRIEEWLKGKTARPILVEVSPTGFCNADCPWCFFKHNKEAEKIDTKVMMRALKEMKEAGVKAINWTGGGEPSLHPDFAKFVKYANEIGLEQGIFTNGYRELPHQELFTWIRISATDQGFKRAKAPKVKFGVVVNMTPNSDMHELMKQAEELGASYFQVRPALTGDPKTQPELYPPVYLKNRSKMVIELTDYKFSEATKERHYDQCYGWHFVPSIDWKGSVGYCLYRIHEPEYIIGNLKDDSFGNIMKSAKKLPVVDRGCQNCCKNHEINKALFDAKRLQDKKFI